MISILKKICVTRVAAIKSKSSKMIVIVIYYTMRVIMRDTKEIVFLLGHFKTYKIVINVIIIYFTFVLLLEYKYYK